MIDIKIVDFSMIIAFWLCFTRWSTIIFQLPLFDNMTVPSMVKILTSLLMTFAFFPTTQVPMLADIQASGVDNFWVLTAFNALIGLVIGFLVKSLMNIFISAGSIITQQVGFGAVRYFDPATSSQIGPFEQLIQWTILIMILTSGAFAPMIKGVYESFFSIQTLNWGQLANTPEFFFMTFKSIFTSALVLASPLIFTNLLIMSVLGIIARTVPQMNVIMVSFAVNIGVGLLVFGATSTEFFQTGYKAYTQELGNWFQLII